MAAFQYIACTVFHYIGVGFAFVVPSTHVKHMLLFFCNIDVHRILELGNVYRFLAGWIPSLYGFT